VRGERTIALPPPHSNDALASLLSLASASLDEVRSQQAAQLQTLDSTTHNLHQPPVSVAQQHQQQPQPQQQQQQQPDDESQPESQPAMDITRLLSPITSDLPSKQ
jgi:type II secretory pathway pseudopilin PulG